MHFRPALFFAIFLALFVSARAGAPPVFLTGTGSTTVTSPYPDYLRSNPGENLKTLPVGKTLVVPIVVSGSGPMTYTATSTTKAMVPIIKTGYPVLNIGITSSGTTDVSGTIATLYPFTGGTDGGNPQAPLFQATDGNYYGTTVTGTGNAGTVFKYSSSLGLTTLHQFTGGADGGNPVGGVIQSGTIGGLFGTTGSGGANGAGTVYLITVSGSLTTLYSFTGGADGGSPMTSLVTGSRWQSLRHNLERRRRRRHGIPDHDFRFADHSPFLHRQPGWRQPRGHADFRLGRQSLRHHGKRRRQWRWHHIRHLDHRLVLDALFLHRRQRWRQSLRRSAARRRGQSLRHHRRQRQQRLRHHLPAEHDRHHPADHPLYIHRAKRWRQSLRRPPPRHGLELLRHRDHQRDDRAGDHLPHHPRGYLCQAGPVPGRRGRRQALRRPHPGHQRQFLRHRRDRRHRLRHHL